MEVGRIGLWLAVRIPLLRQKVRGAFEGNQEHLLPDQIGHLNQYPILIIYFRPRASGQSSFASEGKKRNSEGKMEEGGDVDDAGLMLGWAPHMTNRKSRKTA